jgi:glycosyltransferase involved in cell wall biosynthesis
MMHSVVIPVYNNEASLPDLLDDMERLRHELAGELEVVFVVDGSPDRSLECLLQRLPTCRFCSQVLVLSRNFGSMAAIREGLRAARGPLFCLKAADLQEPSELVLQVFRSLEGELVDVIVATRESRGDPFAARLAAALFWFVYRKVIQRDVPAGGVDIFGCNATFRDHLLRFAESNSSLIGLVFWLGMRRKQIRYRRIQRRHGRSAWTLRARLRYLSDSVFAFSDLPIQLLLASGLLGLGASVVLSVSVLVARLTNAIDVPGYTATLLTVLLFAAINLLGLGIIGSYAWRAFENTKARPLAVVLARHEFGPSVEPMP